ncbi:MAG: hypothetical protein V3T80_05200 [Kiloniellales bacterium]|jgi:hypothetical protein
MPYVVRNAGGRITEVHARKSKAAQEKLAASDPELSKFVGASGKSGDIKSALLHSDLDLIRVLEDLIAVLIDKRIIMLTDLPKAAQQKLAKRYELRSKLADMGGLVVESDEIPLP